MTTHFLEIDRGYEPIASLTGDTGDWTTKIERYNRFLNYRYQQAVYFELLPPPMVLTVTESEARVKSMLEATEQADGQETFWYADRQALYADKSPDCFWKPVWRGVNQEPRSLLTNVS